MHGARPCDWSGDELGPAPLTSTPHRPPTRSETCIIVINATAGCGGVFPCNVTVAVAGATEASFDFVTIWRVTDRAAPLAALNSFVNRLAMLSGPLAYNVTHVLPTGMFLIRFTSNPTVTAAGWSASWQAILPPPPPGTKLCTNRTLTAASGTVEDGSGALPYGNK